MSALIYEKTFQSQVQSLKADYPSISTYLCIDDHSPDEAAADCDYELALSSQPQTRGFEERSDDDIFMIYTGGTTGMPKGVMWRHFDFYHNVVLRTNEADGKPEDILRHASPEHPLRSLILSPLMHGGGQFATIIVLFSGGVAAIPSSRSLNPMEILGIIESQNIGFLNLIGDAMARPIANEMLIGNYNTPSLQIIASGGAILTEPARKLLKQAFGEGIFISGGIGGSEIGAAATEAGSSHDTKGPKFKANPTMLVLDDELEPIAPGDDRIGHLAVKGFIPLGYYNDPAKTAEVFRTDRHGVRWVLAGDRAQVESDGSFTLVGRDSQCINSGGEKIFVEEVERAISLHPCVEMSAVVGVPDPTWQQRVAAVVELKPGTCLTLEELQTHCREHIAGYKIPRELVLANLKRTPNGKTDYRWAKDLVLEQLEHRSAE